jgi:hypothetical protein
MVGHGVSYVSSHARTIIIEPLTLDEIAACATAASPGSDPGTPVCRTIQGKLLRRYVKLCRCGPVEGLSDESRLLEEWSTVVLGVSHLNQSLQA